MPLAQLYAGERGSLRDGTRRGGKALTGQGACEGAGAGVGVVLERSDGEAGGDREPETIRVSSGPETVTLVGRPSELMLYAYGRGDRAQVLSVGEPAALIKLGEVELGL